MSDQIPGHPLLSVHPTKYFVVARTCDPVLDIRRHLDLGIDPRASYPKLTDDEIAAVRSFSEEVRRDAEEDDQHGRQP
jgi:hypothetical protein